MRKFLTNIGHPCNVVCPGNIVTSMISGQKADQLDQDLFGAMLTRADLWIRSCMPEDVANILLFLTSDESAALTGQVLIWNFGATL